MNIQDSKEEKEQKEQSTNLDIENRYQMIADAVKRIQKS